MSAVDKLPQICLSTRNAFFPAGIDGTVEGVKSCLSSRCLHKSLPSPFSLNESSCVQQNDLEPFILSQTHLAWQWPPGMATQTNDFWQRNSTSAFCGLTAQLGAGAGISSTYGTPDRNKGKSVFTLAWPAPLQILVPFPCLCWFSQRIISL